MDILPSLCEAAGIAPPAGIDGRSFLSSITGGEAADGARDLFFGRREGGGAFNGKTIEAVRRGPWKLLRSAPGAPFELYNLEQDPAERSDRAAAEPALVKELAAALEAQLERYAAIPWAPPDGA
jgi:arylsulfatase A-like enzyme